MEARRLPVLLPVFPINTLRHNEIRNTCADLASEAFSQVDLEPKLTPQTGEKFKLKTANKADEARADIKVRGLFTH